MLSTVLLTGRCVVVQSYPCVNTLGGVFLAMENRWALLLRVKVLCVLKKQVSDSRSVSRAGKKQISYRRSLLVPLASLVDVSLPLAVCLAGLTSGRP